MIQQLVSPKVSLAALVCLLVHFCFLPPARAAIGHVLVDPTTILKTADRMDFVGHNLFAVERTPRGTFLAQHAATLFLGSVHETERPRPLADECAMDMAG